MTVLEGFRMKPREDVTINIVGGVKGLDIPVQRVLDFISEFSADFRTGTSALGSGEFEVELASVPPAPAHHGWRRNEKDQQHDLTNRRASLWGE